MDMFVIPILQFFKWKAQKIQEFRLNDIRACYLQDQVANSRSTEELKIRILMEAGEVEVSSLKLESQRRYIEAKNGFQRALDIQKAILGEVDTQVAKSLNQLGRVLLMLGNLPEA